MTTKRRSRRREAPPLRTPYQAQTDREAGAALRGSAPAQQVLAQVLSISESWVSRQVNGHESGAVQRFYRMVRDVTKATKADAGALIAGAVMVAVDAASTLSPQEIRARLRHAIDREATAEGGENAATGPLLHLLGRLDALEAVGLEPEPAARQELRQALEEYQAATREEMGWHCTALIYAGALQVAMGWRVAP